MYKLDDRKMAVNNLKLLMQVSLSKFTFIVKDVLSNHVVFFASEAITSFKSIEEQLEVIFSTYPQLSKHYEQIIVLHDNNLNTFVAQELFDKDNLGLYLQYNTKIFDTDFFAYDHLAQDMMYNIHVPYVNINNFLLDKFGSFTYQNINTELVKHILALEQQDPEHPLVYAYIQKDHFELIIKKQGKLLLYNSFAYTSKEDFIYYVLFCLEQLNIDPQTTKITLLGRIEAHDELYHCAYTYIQEVVIPEQNQQINPNLLLHNLVAKQHYILFHS